MRRLIAHLVGDFILQSDWMAAAKVIGQPRDSRKAAAIHAALYALPFVLFTRNPARLAVIGVTHGLLDHYRPFRQLIYRKNVLLSPGYWPATAPDAIPEWLTIVVDNTAHLAINELALDAFRSER